MLEIGDFISKNGYDGDALYSALKTHMPSDLVPLVHELYSARAPIEQVWRMLQTTAYNPKGPHGPYKKIQSILATPPVDMGQALNKISYMFVPCMRLKGHQSEIH